MKNDPLGNHVTPASLNAMAELLNGLQKGRLTKADARDRLTRILEQDSRRPGRELDLDRLVQVLVSRFKEGGDLSTFVPFREWSA